MTTTSQATSLLPVEKVARRQGTLAGLYWHEWFAHGSQLLFLLSAWLIGQWILQIFLHPGWVIGWGTVLGLWLGLFFGGSDALEGTEEFVLALPGTRGQRYITRLVVSLTFLIGLTGISLLAIGLDWPQKVWGLLVETGFTLPMPEKDPLPYYLMVIACPLAAFGVTFGFAAMATSRDQATLGVLFGFGYTVAGYYVGMVIGMWWVRYGYEDVKREVAILVPFTILLGMAALLLAMGYWGYRRKDGVSRPKGTNSPEWRTALLVSGGLLLLLILAVVVLSSMGSLRW